MLLTEYDDQKEAEIHDREISDAEEKGRAEEHGSIAKNLIAMNMPSADIVKAAEGIWWKRLCIGHSLSFWQPAVDNEGIH